MWPEYAVRVHGELGCETFLVVLVMEEKTASWARRPIQIGNFTLTPMVLSLEQLPVIEEAGEASEGLELSVLSVMAHGHSEHAGRVAKATLSAIEKRMKQPHEVVDEERWMFYYDLVFTSVNAKIREELERMLAGYEYQSEFAKRYFTQGLAKGEARGKAEGKAEGKASTLLTLLEARELPISASQRERILGCRDLTTLEQWVRRAVTASSLSDVLGPN